MKDKLFPYLTGVLCVGVAVLAAYTFTHQYRLPKDVARTSDIRKAEGIQNLAGRCKQNITATVKNNGGTLGKLEVVGVGKGTITVEIASDIYSGYLKCTFLKSVWSLQSVNPTPKPKKPSS